MTLLADKDERFKGLFVKVSIFMLLAVAGIMFNFLYAALRQGLFVHKTPVYFVAPSSQNIHEGMAVKLSGFKIGTVDKMVLNDMAQTRVELLIEERYMHFLRTDAEISAIRENVIGDNVLSIARGSEKKPHLLAGGEIRYIPGGGLDQITQDLREQLFPAISDLSKLLHDVNEPDGDIRVTLHNVRELSTDLKGTRARMDKFLDRSNEMMVKDMHPMMQSMNRVASKLDKELPVMLDNANATFESLKKSSAAIQSAVETSAPQFSGMAGEGRELINETRKTVDSLNNSWLLRSGMPSEPDGPVRMDSND